MRTAKLAVLIVLLLIATPLCVSDGLDAKKDPAKLDETDPPEPPTPVDTTICGYVGDVSNLEKNVPRSGVTVKLMDMNRQLIGTVLTDEEGYFEFTYTDGAGTYLTFDLEGYTVRTQPSLLYKVEGEINTLYFSHQDVVDKIKPESDGKFLITSNIEGGSFVGMSITTALITGYVQNTDGAYVQNAKVTLKSIDNQNIVGYTDEDGYFEIECYFGNYTMTVSCSGFEESDPVIVSTNNKTLEITLDEKVHSVLLGLDTPHTWEFLSIIFMALTVLLFLGINYRIKKGKSEIVMINDLELEPEEEEKD